MGTPLNSHTEISTPATPQIMGNCFQGEISFLNRKSKPEVLVQILVQIKKHLLVKST